MKFYQLLIWSPVRRHWEYYGGLHHHMLWGRVTELSADIVARTMRPVMVLEV